MSILEVDTEVFNRVDDSKTLEFGCRSSGLRITELSGIKGDVFTILHENSTDSNSESVRVELYWLVSIENAADWIVREKLFELLKFSALFKTP